MTHNQAIGAMITAILTDYRTVDAGSLDLDQFLELHAVETSTPAVYCRGYMQVPAEGMVMNDGSVEAIERTAVAYLVARTRDLDDDLDTLLDGLSATAAARHYTARGTRWMARWTLTEHSDADFGFPVARIEFYITQA